MADLQPARSDWDAPERHQFVREIAEVVREADKNFEADGGGTRHWVRDHFLPGLEDAGFVIARRP